MPLCLSSIPDISLIEVHAKTWNGHCPKTLLSRNRSFNSLFVQTSWRFFLCPFSWQICNRKGWLPFPFLANELHTANYTPLYTIIYYYTILCYTILYYTILYYTILYYTILYYTILYYTILYYTMLYYTILYYTMLCYIILYYTILYYTMPCFAILYGYYTLICSLLGRQRMSDIQAYWKGHHISSVAWVLRTWSWTYQKQLFVLVPCNRLLVNLNTAVLWIVWEKLTVDVLTSDTQPAYFYASFSQSYSSPKHLPNPRFECTKAGCIHWSDVFQMVWLYCLWE